MKIPVALLITIDPVGQPRALVWSMESYRGIARHWVTVIAHKPGIDVSDMVAHAWGKTPMALQGLANSVIHDAGADHRQFDVMMRTANAESLIANVYRAGR